jgi:hypothetical protein
MRGFLATAAGLLFATALAKLVSALGSARSLQTVEPLFGVTIGQLLWAVGFLELAISIFVAVARSVRLRAAVIAWLAASCLAYRLGLVWIGYSGPCRCLGSLTEMLGVRAALADRAMQLLLAYLLLGSSVVLWLLRCPRTPKIACSAPELGGHTIP